MPRLRRASLHRLAVILLLAGCTTNPDRDGAPPWSNPAKPMQGTIKITGPTPEAAGADQAKLFRGTGQ